MTVANLLGTIGVTLLLIAFVLQTLKIVDEENLLFGLLNVSGALLAGVASLLIPFIPFVILEGIWALVGSVVLIRSLQRKNARPD